MVDVRWMLWLILSIALPLASLAVLVAGLRHRRDRPAWLLWCAATVATAALVILLIMLRIESGDSLLLALSVWFALCLLVLGLALGRRWRGQSSRPLELAGLLMPFVVLALLAGLLALTALTPPTPVDGHPAVQLDHPLPVAFSHSGSATPKV